MKGLEKASKFETPEVCCFKHYGRLTTTNISLTATWTRSPATPSAYQRRNSSQWKPRPWRQTVSVATNHIFLKRFCLMKYVYLPLPQSFQTLLVSCRRWWTTSARQLSSRCLARRRDSQTCQTNQYTSARRGRLCGDHVQPHQICLHGWQGMC